MGRIITLFMCLMLNMLLNVHLKAQTTVEFVASEDKAESYSATSLAKDGVTISGTSGKIGLGYSYDNYYVYAGYSLKVTASYGTITSITLTQYEKQATTYSIANLSADCGTLSNLSGGIRTWVGESAEVVFTANNKAASLSKISVTYIPVAVSVPTLTEGFTFWPVMDKTPSAKYTITPSSGTTVYYTTDGSSPSNTNGTKITSAVTNTISATTTVKAIAYVGTEESTVVERTYTLGETVEGIAAFRALPENTVARLYLPDEYNARVLFTSGNNVFVRDNTGAICFYGINTDHSMNYNQHLAGWIVGKSVSYYGLPEFASTPYTNTKSLLIADRVTEENTQPVEISAADYDNYYADWVKIKDLKVSEGDSEVLLTDDSDNQLVLYNKYSIDKSSYYETPYAAALVDLTGLAIPYNSKKELAPIYQSLVDARPLVYVVNEEKDFTLPAADIEGASVRLNRTLSSSYWNTLTLPFDVSIEGEVRQYNKLSADGVTMLFTSAESIGAGVPYLVKPSEDWENPTFKDITLRSNVATTVTDGAYSYVGTYSPVSLATDKTERYLGPDDKLYYPTADGNKLKGMRAYFRVPAANDAKISIDGVDTAITDVSLGDIVVPSEVYNLRGQKVGSTLEDLPKGIYVVNGHKVIIK